MTPSTMIPHSSSAMAMGSNTVRATKGPNLVCVYRQTPVEDTDDSRWTVRTVDRTAWRRTLFLFATEELQVGETRMRKGRRRERGNQETRAIAALALAIPSYTAWFISSEQGKPRFTPANHWHVGLSQCDHPESRVTTR